LPHKWIYLTVVQNTFDRDVLGVLTIVIITLHKMYNQKMVHAKLSTAYTERRQIDGEKGN
jgi:hypothetical protein